MKFRLMLLLVLVLGLVAVPATIYAQPENVVYAVLFYSPTCPHCHKVIEQDLPPIQAQFGDQLVVIFVNASTAEGLAIFSEAGDIINLPKGQWGGVPTMVIGSTVLRGDQEIPAEMAAVVSAGIAAGGINLPDFPKLQAAYGTIQPEQAQALSPPSKLSWQDRFNNDVTANSLAVGVLILLIVNISLLLIAGRTLLKTNRLPTWAQDHARRWMILSLTVFCLLIASTLIIEQAGAPALLAGIVAALLIGVLGMELRLASCLE